MKILLIILLIVAFLGIEFDFDSTKGNKFGFSFGKAADTEETYAFDGFNILLVVWSRRLPLASG